MFLSIRLNHLNQHLAIFYPLEHFGTHGALWSIGTLFSKTHPLEASLQHISYIRETEDIPVARREMVFYLRIEVKSYLKKFLAFHHPVDPFVLTEKNRYGLFILNSLRHSEILRRGNRYTLQGHTVPMEILLREHYERSFGLHISKWHQYQFNSFLLDEFHDRMLEHVANQYTGRKGDYKRSLLDLREKYAITEDDLAFKTLEKMFEREKYRLTNYLPAG